MLMNMKDLLVVAQENHFVIPVSNIGNDQLSRVVMKRVRELNSPVILEMSPDEFNFIGDAQIQAMTYEVVQTGVPVCIHLGHGGSHGIAIRIIRAGMTSVMIDASTLPYGEDVAATKEIVETAHITDASVESELGTIGTTGNSIEGGAQGVIYTVPEEAEQLIKDTGINTFAVTIDTVYGIYPKDMKPELRIDTLKNITSKVGVPLILHGEFGNKDKEIAAVVDNGICKTNISSDIKVVLCTQCRKIPNENPDCREPLEIYPEATEACEKVVEGRIRLFKSNDKVKYHY